MTTLHVTRELGRALKLPVKLAVAADAGPTALGPWSFGLVHCRPAKMVVAVSVPTRWAFALPAAPLAGLGRRFGPALMMNLVALGVPADRARAEVDAHGEMPWALGHDRGALTHLNQCVEDVLWAIHEGLSLPSVNRRLAERIILKPRAGTPGSDVMRLLGGDPEALLAQKRREGAAWGELYEAMQSQAGQQTVTLPVRRLLAVEHLEARHQAHMLLDRLPTDNTRRLPSGRTPRWIPQVLVLDMEGIETVSPIFFQTLRAQAEQLQLGKMVLANVSQAVAENLL